MENGLEFREETLSQNVVAQRSPNTGSTVYYVAVYKESDSGLLYNPRLIVIQDKNFNIFYTKHFKPIHKLSQMQKKGDNPIKEQLLIINTNAEVEQNIVSIIFIHEGVKKKWNFRFYNEKIALNWYLLYKDLQERYIVKSTKSKSKDTDTNSASNSEYSSILSQNRYYTQYIDPNISIRSEQQKIEKDLKKEKIQKSQLRRKEVDLCQKSNKEQGK